MARVIKILVFLVIISGSVVGGYFWLQAREPDDGGLELISVTRGSITEKAVAVGQIEPRSNSTSSRRSPASSSAA